MDDWDDLLDVDPDEYRQNPEEEEQEQEQLLGISEDAHIETEIDEINVSGNYSKEVREQAKQNFRRTASGGRVLFESGACQPESDGDITCKFELAGPVNVKVQKQKPGGMMGQTEEVEVQVNPEGRVVAEDFDEFRAHELNRITHDEDSTVIS